MERQHQEIIQLIDKVEEGVRTFEEPVSEEAKQARLKLAELRSEGKIPAEMEPRLKNLSALESIGADW